MLESGVHQVLERKKKKDKDKIFYFRVVDLVE